MQDYQDQNGGQSQPGTGTGDPAHPSWLPPGYTLNPDGSITSPGGQVMPAPGPGQTRDPNTGQITYTGTGNPADQPTVPLGPGTNTGQVGPNFGPTAPTSTPPPVDTLGGGGGGPTDTTGGGGTLGLPYPTVGTPGPTTTNGPLPNLPTYKQAPGYTPPPAFSYQDFVAPTGADVLNDTGYQFRLGQGTNALQASAAARGVLNTGGTLKDILGYGQDLASTEYGNAYGRAANTYATNRSNALDTYNTNYQTQYKDPYSTNYQTQYVDPFAANSQSATTMYGAQAANSSQNQYYNFQTWLQNYNMNRQNQNDAFNQRYALLNFQ